MNITQLLVFVLQLIMMTNLSEISGSIKSKLDLSPNLTLDSVKANDLIKDQMKE